MKTLHFHTGRGGQFFNPGHVSFRGFETIHETGIFNEYYFYYSQEDIEDPDIIKEEPGWYRANGDMLDYEINEDGTGFIHSDTIYDSDHWVKEEDLNEKQIEAIVEWYNESLCGPIPYSDEAEIRRIIHEHYPNYITELEQEDDDDE